MTREGWIILGFIALYFLRRPIAFVTKLFFEGLFAGLGVRSSGVVRRLSQRPKPSQKIPNSAAFTAVRIAGQWRIKTAAGEVLEWTFSSRAAAEKVIEALDRKAA